jgi:hypothetical protein
VRPAPQCRGVTYTSHGWHMSLDRVTTPHVPASGRARRAEIQRRTHLPPDLLNDPTYTEGSHNWDMWFKAKHDTCRHTLFASRATTRSTSIS